MADRHDPLGPGTPPLDTPRPLPDAVRDRLEEALLSAIDDVDVDVVASLPWAHVDAPRPLPDVLRARLEVAIARRVVVPRWREPRLLGAAALALLVLAVAVIATGNRGPRAGDVASRPPATRSANDARTDGGADIAGEAAATASTAPGVAPAPSARPAVGGAGASGVGGAAAFPTTGAAGGPPPPFAFGPDGRSSAAADEAAGAPSAPRPSAGAPPLRVGVVAGDVVQERAFQGYVDVLNQAGGIGGRQVVLVDVAPGRSASGLVGTVNLSAGAIATTAGAPSWTTAPLLETLAATESLLRSNVYGFAGPVERQARLAADLVYPGAAAGMTAVVYRAESGVFADVVPAAIRQVLTGRGVTVVESVYGGGPPSVVPGSDAVFLSLDRHAASAWVKSARAAGFITPRRGVTGVHTLFEPTAAADALPGTRVMSPYLLPRGDEADALRAAVDESVGAAAVHGWTTAKSLAVALWRSGATSPQQAAAALNGMGGYSSGVAPPYEVRPGTHSRTPEAAPFEVRNSAFVQTGEFRRDPH